MTLLAVGWVFLVCGAGWSVSVLADEDLYLRAVAPLGHSPLFARVSGRYVTRSARGRLEGWPLVGSRGPGLLGSMTRSFMGTRAFSWLWPATQRFAHRRRSGGGLPGSTLRTAAAMVFLATLGSAIRIWRAARGSAARLTTVRLRAGRRW